MFETAETVFAYVYGALAVAIGFITLPKPGEGSQMLARLWAIISMVGGVIGTILGAAAYSYGDFCMGCRLPLAST